MRDDKEKPGPKEERLKIDHSFDEAIKKALNKERPQEGWPKPDKETNKPEK